MLAVTVGGAPWSEFNASAETVDVSAAQLRQPGMATRLRDIVAHY